MIIFLVKSAICLALLYTFYVLFLEKQKMHKFNRFYLLGILVVSLVIPNIILNVESSIIYTTSEFVGSSSSLQISNYIFIIYGIITIILLLKFSVILITIFKRIKNNKKIVQHSNTLVLLEEKVLPHTFLSYVFLNKNDYEKGNIQDELFTHELTHVNEKHTLDILFIELFQIIFWFNPILYLLKKSIRLNHEFLADETVISAYDNTVKYQHILLNISSWNNTNCLTSNINYSLTKKRFQMMVKKSSQFTKNSMKFSLIPLLFISIVLFANTTINSEKGHHNDNLLNSAEENHSNRERLEKNHKDEFQDNDNSESNHND